MSAIFGLDLDTIHLIRDEDPQGHVSNKTKRNRRSGNDADEFASALSRRCRNQCAFGSKSPRFSHLDPKLFCAVDESLIQVPRLNTIQEPCLLKAYTTVSVQSGGSNMGVFSGNYVFIASLV